MVFKSGLLLLLSLAAFLTLEVSEGKTASDKSDASDPVEEELATTSTKNEITGSLKRILDGDTFVLIDEHPRDVATRKSGQDIKISTKEAKIRLGVIDAPEKGQDFSAKSGEYLESLLRDRKITVSSYMIDRDCRFVGKVTVDGKDVGLEMIKGGYAWYFKKYGSSLSADERAAYQEAHDAAKAAKIGLWSLPNPIEPYDWRHHFKKGVRVSGFPANAETPATPTTDSNRVKSAAAPDSPIKGKFWLNTKTGVRHNATCKNFGNSANGRYCEAAEGKPCGICGG